jgi:hypothetical protein
MGIISEKQQQVPRLKRPFSLFRGKAKQSSTPKKTVSFATEATVCNYPAPVGEERALYYPTMTEQEVVLEHRRNVMSSYMKGSARFKESVEKVYSGARKKHDEKELISGEFTLDSYENDESDDIYKMVASDIRGLEEFYCHVITDHRSWAVKRVVQCQRDRAARKILAEIASTVSTRSKNFARLVALGDAEEAKRVSTAHAA